MVKSGVCDAHHKNALFCIYCCFWRTRPLDSAVDLVERCGEIANARANEANCPTHNSLVAFNGDAVPLDLRRATRLGDKSAKTGSLPFNPSDNCSTPKSAQLRGIRTIRQPLIPSGVVEFTHKVPRTLLLAATRCTHALEFVEQQKVVFLKLPSIDLKRVHPAEQEVGIDALVRSWFAHSRAPTVAKFRLEVKQPCVFPKS